MSHADSDTMGEPKKAVTLGPWKQPVAQPEVDLRVDARAGTLAVDHRGKQAASIPLSLQTIHSLFDSIGNNLLSDGISLHISEKSLATPLGFEALLQTIMMNMVSCIQPRLSVWSSPDMHSMDAEINYIRNSACLNELNHLHILKNRLSGLPLLLALPGPSLDMEYIREHRASFVLLAAGRASRMLIDEGIYPDFIYIQDVNTNAWEQNFSSLGDKRIPSTLIANPLGRVWKFRKNFKRVFKAWNLYPFEKDCFPKISEIAPSSVSGAYSVARLLGCDPIVFIGNDCGTNVEPSEDTGLPQALTNLEHERPGADLVFSPVTNVRNLYLRFGDEFSMMTQLDYTAGAQWLKMRTKRDVSEAGIRVYDRSLTRLCQFNSPIEDASGYTPAGHVALPELPRYETRYDVLKYLLYKKKTYEFIMRQFNAGRVPGSALSKPGNSVFCRTLFAQKRYAEPSDTDMARAKDNAIQLVDHVNTALSELNGV